MSSNTRKKKNSSPSAPSPIASAKSAPSISSEAAANALHGEVSALDDSVSALSAPSSRFLLGAWLILLLGIALRQFALGSAPFHPDEAIHAYFSQNLATYKYDPVYHGPLLYHLTGAIMGVFGEYDYTARLMPSLMGILLLWMVLFPARQWLGSRGSLASAGLIALSTSLVTYSRHLLHDALALVLTLGAVLCVASMWTNPANTTTGRNARLGLAALLTLFLATKANCFFIIVMLLAFFVAWRAAGLITIPLHATRWVPLLCFALVSAAAIRFPIAFLNVGTDNITPSPQHLKFQQAVLLSCAWLWFWLWTRRPDEAEANVKRTTIANFDLTTYILAIAVGLWLYYFLFGNVAQVFLQWGMHKSFPVETFKNGRELAQGAVHRMLEYWGGQQKKPRLPGQHDYYIILALLYEVPILLSALGGIWHYSKNRTAWTDLLMWWAFTSWAIYAVANEKVPWLLVHMMLPLALLGGMWLGQIRWNKPALALAAVLGLAFSARGDYGIIFERAGDNAEPIFYAQTPDSFRDALLDALKATQGQPGSLGMDSSKEWPAVWYFRPRNNPLVGKSTQAIGGVPDLNTLRVMVGMPTSGDGDVPDPLRPMADPKEESAMLKAGWDVKTVDMLIWPRAHWPGLRPDRYLHWWLTRDTLPQSEREESPSKWDISILSGGGEWSHQRTVVGHAR